VFSMFYGETIVTKTIDYQASFLILNGTAVMVTLRMWTESSFAIYEKKVLVTKDLYELNTPQLLPRCTLLMRLVHELGNNAIEGA
ncbi:MAG: hypothetical protein ABW087_06820, partial [Candidatus Thiodiazotropha sp.]